MSTSSVTKHLSNLSLDSQKKITASPEFVPGRGLTTGSNSSSPNLFNNSYAHSQENVGGTTYFYFGNATNDAVGTEDGTEVSHIYLSFNNFCSRVFFRHVTKNNSFYPPLLQIGPVTAGQIGYVYPGTPSHLQPIKPAKPPSSNNSSAPSTPPPQAAPSFFVSESLRLDILQKNALTLTQPDVIRFPDLPNEVDNYHELCPLEPIHKPASTVLGYQTSTYKATNIKTGTRYCLRRVHGKFFFPPIARIIYR